MTKHERCGWRDARISARHRLWGSDCPATDLDAIITASTQDAVAGSDDMGLNMLEYDRAKPVALIEYRNVGKNGTMEFIDCSPSGVATAWLAAEKVPAFAVGYDIRAPFDAWFFVTPLNETIEPWARLAIDLFFSPERSHPLAPELEFVKFLYWLRSRPFPHHVATAIQSTPWPLAAQPSIQRLWTRPA